MKWYQSKIVVGVHVADMNYSLIIAPFNWFFGFRSDETIIGRIVMCGLGPLTLTLCRIPR